MIYLKVPKNYPLLKSMLKLKIKNSNSLHLLPEKFEFYMLIKSSKLSSKINGISHITGLLERWNFLDTSSCTEASIKLKASTLTMFWRYQQYQA